MDSLLLILLTIIFDYSAKLSILDKAHLYILNLEIIYYLDNKTVSLIDGDRNIYYSHHSIITKFVKSKMGEAQSVSLSSRNYLALRCSAADRSDCFARHSNVCFDYYYDSADVSSNDLSYRRLCRILYIFDFCYLNG